jgi:hypothetical protein
VLLDPARVPVRGSVDIGLDLKKTKRGYWALEKNKKAREEIKT